MVLDRLYSTFNHASFKDKWHKGVSSFGTDLTEKKTNKTKVLPQPSKHHHYKHTFNVTWIVPYIVYKT